jgi:hypothetical protein
MERPTLLLLRVMVVNVRPCMLSKWLLLLEGAVPVATGATATSETAEGSDGGRCTTARSLPAITAATNSCTHRGTTEDHGRDQRNILEGFVLRVFVYLDATTMMTMMMCLYSAVLRVQYSICR